ncbi:hypothetical protein F5141DRAFT_1067082 [Pisolithus sp. B1]|nr:hypothetical protein F5141DRAFT_1067082 [Pisolithus sp. B1]
MYVATETFPGLRTPTVRRDLGEVEDFPGRVTSKHSHSQLHSASDPTSKSHVQVNHKHIFENCRTYSAPTFRFFSCNPRVLDVATESHKACATEVRNNTLPRWFFVTPNIKETRSTILLILLGGAVPSNLKGAIDNYVHYSAFASALRSVAHSHEPHLQSPPFKATECSATSDDMTATGIPICCGCDGYKNNGLTNGTVPLLSLTGTIPGPLNPSYLAPWPGPKTGCIGAGVSFILKLDSVPSNLELCTLGDNIGFSSSPIDIPTKLTTLSIRFTRKQLATKPMVKRGSPDPHPFTSSVVWEWDKHLPKAANLDVDVPLDRGGFVTEISGCCFNPLCIGQSHLRSVR